MMRQRVTSFLARRLRAAGSWATGAVQRGLGIGEEVAFAGRMARGGIAIVIAAALAVAARLHTGRSFENMGQAVREFVFGGLDEKAIATETVRERLLADRQLLATIGYEGIKPEHRQMFAELVRQEEAVQRGRSAFMQATTFQQNGLADIAILAMTHGRAARVFEQEWEKNDPGKQSLREFAKTLREAHGTRGR